MLHYVTVTMSNHGPKLCIDKIIKSKGDPYESNVGISPIIRAKYWNTGQTLRIRFLSGDPIVQDKVKRFANEWLSHANLNFDFIFEGDADIRIDFRREGSWSYIGTDAKSIPQNEPTMNYGWLDIDTPDSEYYIVLHEFGHALGLIHEMQNPAGNISWDKEAVYKYYMGPPNNWSKEDVDHNLFARYSKTITNFTKFDPKSIMLYHHLGFILPNNNNFLSNTTLSMIDKHIIQKLYPSKKVSKEYNQPITKSNDPLEIIKERLAKGEINKEEFRELRRIILED